jgi:hypothetical protein
MTGNAHAVSWESGDHNRPQAADMTRWLCDYPKVEETDFANDLPLRNSHDAKAGLLRRCAVEDPFNSASLRLDEAVMFNAVAPAAL